MSNFALAVKELEKDILFEERMHKQKIEEMKNHLNYLKRHNTACEKCDGTGRVERVIDYETNFTAQTVECNVCNGSGKKI